MLKIVFISLSMLLCTNLMAGSWHQKSDFGGVGRHRAVGITINNKGYLGLGHVNGSGIDISYKDWWQYDPASDSWTQKADFPVINHGAVGFSIANKGYIGGGSMLNGEFFAYDPAVNQWQPIAFCPISPAETQGFSIQDKGYVYMASQIAEYNPGSNSWQLKSNAPFGLNTWSSAFASSGSGFIKTNNKLLEYKPSQDQWYYRADFPGQMSNGSSAFAIDDKGYFTCGYTSSLSAVTDQVWEYNPGNNEWKLVEEFPGTKRRFPVAFSINGIGYYGTGTNGINMNDFWQYQPGDLNVHESGISEAEFIVYPNPAQNNTTIQFNGTLPFEKYTYKLKLIGLDGTVHQILNADSDKLTLKRNNLSSGVYILNLEKDGTTLKRMKFIFL